MPEEPAIAGNGQMYRAAYDLGVIKATANNFALKVSLAMDGLDILTDLEVADMSRLMLDIECWAGANDQYVMRLTVSFVPAGAVSSPQVLVSNTMEIQRPTNFVFRATAWNQDTNELDATPVSHFFTIIPGTMEQYLESSRGEQPVKTHETQ